MGRVPVMQRLRGFTLIELMVTLAVLAILMGIGVPAFQEVSLSTTLRSNANKLVAGAQLARSEAIKRNAVVRMCVSTNGTTCATGSSWEKGWIVVQGATILLSQSEAENGYKILSSVSAIDFQPSGVGAGQATLKICRATPSIGSQDRQVTISATGHASTDKGSSGSCS